MQYVSRLLSGVKEFYGEINSATLTGATDVLVVRQPDGSLVCSPIHVRFGKIGVLRTLEREVDIQINGRPVDIHMRLGETGQAYFPPAGQTPASQTTLLSSALIDDASAMKHLRRRCMSENIMPTQEDAAIERRRLISSPPASFPSVPSSPVLRRDVLHFPPPSAPEAQAHQDVTSRQEEEQEETDSLGACSPPPVSTCVLSDDSCESGCSVGTRALMSPPLGSSPPPEEPALPEVSLSLCGPADLGRFETERVSFTDLSSSPALLSDPRLVVRLNGRYLTWVTAAPAIISMVAFGKQLPKTSMRLLSEQARPPKRRSLTSWLRWRHRTSSDNSSGSDVKFSMGWSDDSSSEEERERGEDSPRPASQRRESSVAGGIDLSDDSGAETEGGEHAPEVAADASSSSEPAQSPSLEDRKSATKNLKLTSDQLISLGLREGMNCVTYSVTTAYQGTTRCRAHIYLLNWHDKIIISDIDGTITRSDVLGQLLPLVGKDWSQGGVVNLYTSVVENGYKMLYLSARAIGQAGYTKGYLNWVEQQQLKLPEGPLLLTPESLLVAFRKEVIEKKPEDIKIQLLQEVRGLFPAEHYPFYAGFGNKSNDETAYAAVGIPESRIFLINPKGELTPVSHASQTASYTKLHQLVDHYFPAVTSQEQERIAFASPSRFSSFTYWRAPLVDVSEGIDQLLNPAKSR